MTHIYFLREPQGGAIKIGVSYNIGKRIAQLESGLPYHLELIGILEGDWHKEQELHFKFSEYKIKGEWYKPVPEIITFIEQNAKLKEVPFNLEKAAKEMEGKPLTKAGEECRRLLELSENKTEGSAPPTERLLKIKQAAELLGISVGTLRKWEASGRIEATRTEGRHRRFTDSDLQKIRKQMMMGAEFIIPSITPFFIIDGIKNILSNFDPNEKINISIRQDALADKIRVLIDSADGLNNVTKSFNIKE